MSEHENKSAADKLRMLADFIEHKVPEKQWNYQFFSSKQEAPKFNCGTTGCAAGWSEQCFNHQFFKTDGCFSTVNFIKFMGIADHHFYDLFCDHDYTLFNVYGRNVPKTAVAARLRQAAEEYD